MPIFGKENIWMRSTILKTHYNLGVVYFNIKDYQSAENEWLNAIELEKEIDFPSLASCTRESVYETGAN
jgi:hypothetical protein